MDKAAVLKREFTKIFGGPCEVFRAPGRVNLIGEHTDYNQGFVMPAAIELAIRVAAAVSNIPRLAVYSAHFNETVEFSFAEIDSGGRRQHWSDYVRGVAYAIRRAGLSFPGANLLINGEVPIGSGLSSSAALEVATAISLLKLAGVALGRTEIAQLCQRAENEYVGARCGIMDQFASCHGKKGHAILLDCRSLESQYLRLPERIHLVVCNTMVKHEIASGEYNLRRRQCEEGVRELQKHLPGIVALRDVSPQQLERCAEHLDPLIYRRAKHVVEENGRVLAAAEALVDGRLSEFGELMNASHASLRDFYEVSCPELDLMVKIAMECPGAYGSRMMGGGFGGCTISLVDDLSTTRFIEQVTEQYRGATGIRCEIYVCAAEDGAAKESE